MKEGGRWSAVLKVLVMRRRISVSNYFVHPRVLEIRAHVHICINSHAD